MNDVEGESCASGFHGEQECKTFFFWFLRNANTHPGLIIPVDK